MDPHRHCGRTCLRPLLLAGAVLILAGCAKTEPPSPTALRTVRTETVYLDGAERTRTFSGVARASIESQLSFKVSGTVRRVDVRVGDQVRAGAPIASLDPTDYELQVENARATLLRQQAAARNARTTYERVEALYENNNAPLAELESARANDESARAAVQSAQKALELAQTQLSYTALTAPVDGSISAVRIEAGENVAPGAPVAVLSAGSRIEIEVSIPEMLITGVREGQPVTALFDAVAGRAFEATVTEVGVSASSGASAYPVTVRLDQPTEDVLPGMACEVSFRFDTHGGRDLIVVPPTAIAEDVDGRYAIVVRDVEDGEGRATRVAVTVGDLTPDGLEVLSGLDDGDRVVTAGVDRLYDGEAVRLWRHGDGGR